MKTSTDIIKIAKESIAIQLDAIRELENSINDNFANVINLLLNLNNHNLNQW